jgi:hypothetical protein
MMIRSVAAGSLMFVAALPGIVVAPVACYVDGFQCNSSCDSGGTASYYEDNPVQANPGEYSPISWGWKVMQCYAFTENIDISCDAPLPLFW